eukprot:g8412.t1
MSSIERRFREACSRGDIKLFSLDEAVCTTSRVGRLLVRRTRNRRTRIPSLDFTFTDDSCNSIVHYLAGAEPPRSRRKLRLMRFHLLKKQRPMETDSQRASIIDSLLSENRSLNFLLLNTRRQNVLHFCAETNSVAVLRTILDAVFTGKIASTQTPLLEQEDENGMTPFIVALQQHNFKCVQLLVTAGAYPLDVQDTPPVQSPVPEQGPSVVWSILQSIAKSFIGMFGRKEEKLQELHAELDLTRESYVDTGGGGGGVEVLRGLGEIRTDYLQSLEQLRMHFHTDESTAASVFFNRNFDLERILSSDPIPSFSHSVENTGPVFCDKLCLQERQCEEQDFCQVCFEELKDRRNKIRLPCNHPTCDTCWKGILLARMSEGAVHRSICPSPDCNLPFPVSCLPQILPQQDFERFLNLLSSKYVDLSPQIKWCPAPHCGSAVKANEPESVLTTSCSCGTEFCFSCSSSPHDPATCEQVEEWKSILETINSDKESMEWINRKTVPCPNCKAPIERNGGCNQVTCTICWTVFCYRCGQLWAGHDDHYICRLVPEQEPIEIESVPNGIWTGVQELLGNLKKRISTSSFWWHMRQYLANDFNAIQYQCVGNYMTQLLQLTLPTELLVEGVGFERKIDSPETEVQHLRVLVETIISSKRVYKNSFILAFYLRSGSSKRKFLIRLQKQLQPLLDEITVHLTHFPGFDQITTPNQQMVSSDVTFTKDVELLKRQFVYVHELHKRRREIMSFCQLVCRFRNDVIRAGRLGMFQHRKQFAPILPPTTDFEPLTS